MKKHFILLALFATSVSFAQDREKGTIEIAPTVGISVAQYLGVNSYYNADPLYSSTVGVNFDVYLSNVWSLRSGLHYQIMGGEEYNYYYNSTNFTSSWTTQRLDYLTLPIHGNLHFGSKRNWNLNFGPTIGFLLRAEYESNNYVMDNSEHFKRAQLGLGVGMGHNFKIKENMGIGLQLNQTIGLTNIDNNRFYVSNFYNDNNYYTQNYYITLGVSFIFTSSSVSKEE